MPRHIVGELMKGFHLKRPLGQEREEQLGEMAHHLQEALPAIPLTQNQVLSTAYANDVEPDMIFAQQVYGYGQDGECPDCAYHDREIQRMCSVRQKLQ